MSKPGEFSFGNDSVAKAYDTVLVPTLFEPWTSQLVQENQPWLGKKVLDLACGTGVVTRDLVPNVIPGGKIIALDINRQMLDIAKLKCAEWTSHIEFTEGSAEALEIPDSTIDTVVCQQGFQFFPDRKTAACEIHRVLKPGGMAIISTWCSVNECEIFGAICETLESMNENEISQMMRVPFDFITQDELLQSFKEVGFSDLKISKQEQNLFINGGVDQAIIFAYATPIGPKLRDLSNERQKEFKKTFSEKCYVLSQGDGSIGRMVSNVLNTVK